MRSQPEGKAEAGDAATENDEIETHEENELGVRIQDLGEEINGFAQSAARASHKPTVATLRPHEITIKEPSHSTRPLVSQAAPAFCPGWGQHILARGERSEPLETR